MPFSELRAIAHRSLHLAENQERAASGQPLQKADWMRFRSSSDLEAVFSAVAENEYSSRAMRWEFVPGGLLGEPAWDILLDLYVQRARGRSVSIKSASVASQVPASTALRWISIVEAAGLVSRAGSETDRRIQFLDLTARGREAVEAYLAARARDLSTFVLGLGLKAF